MDFADRYYDINDYGAKGDGRTLNTQAINAAISACSANGGGHVVVKKGCYMSGPIRLLSGVDLRLEAGAVIMFTRDYSAYPLIMSHYEGYPSVRCTSPLWATGETDIAVTGEGVLDGNGDAWWPVKRWEQTDMQWEYRLKYLGGVDDDDPVRHMWWPTDVHKAGLEYFKKMRGIVLDLDEAEKYHPFFRPCLLEIKNCKNVLIDGITVQNSPAWSVHTFCCEDVRVNALRVKNPWNAPNTDGLNLECTQNALVTGCTFDVGDDALCVKAGRNKEGRKIAVPTRNITVKNCNVYAAHGGITVGSETACGIDEVKVSGCVFTGTDRGIRIKSAYGRGGLIRNIEFRDIIMKGIRDAAVEIKMSEDKASMPADTTVNPDGSFAYTADDMPVFRDITMENIMCGSALYAIEAKGLPGIEISRIKVKDSYFRSKLGIKIEDVEGISLENVVSEIY